MIFIVGRAHLFEDMHYTVRTHNRIASAFLYYVKEFPGNYWIESPQHVSIMSKISLGITEYNRCQS